MICVHLKELFQLCQENEIRISSADLVRVVCHQCGAHEVCPSALTSEFSENGLADFSENGPADAESQAAPPTPTSDTSKGE
jgi:hypothetical protein